MRQSARPVPLLRARFPGIVYQPALGRLFPHLRARQKVGFHLMIGNRATSRQKKKAGSNPALGKLKLSLNLFSSVTAAAAAIATIASAAIATAVSAVTTAPSAAAAESTAAAATTTAAATPTEATAFAATPTTATKSAWSTLFARTGNIHRQGAAFHFMSVEFLDRFLRFVAVRHRDECETTGTAGEFVEDDFNDTDGANLAKQGFEILGGAGEGKVPHVELAVI